MRVGATLVMIAAGCGRIGIDPQPLRSDADVVDGPRGPDALVMQVASSFDDWDIVQGSGGWYYGAWNRTTDGNAAYDAAADFEVFSAFPGELWRPTTWEMEPGPNFTWAYIGRTLIHPGSAPEERSPIRRWVSDIAGPATVTLTLAKSDGNGGDGVIGLVYVDGTKMFERLVTGTDTVGFTEDVLVDLAIDSKVDVMLDFNIDDAIDTSNMSVAVSTR